LKILALVPDPRAAYGLGDVLAGIPRRSLRVVAFGQTTAAALPAGLDVMVYPVREGTRLPGPFLDALVQHEWPEVLLAPAGAVRAASVPTLLVDLDSSLPISELAPDEEDVRSGWLEAVTTDADRRRELLRAGVFSVELDPALLSAPGRVSARAVGLLLTRMADMAGLSGRSSPLRANSESFAGVSAPAPAFRLDARVSPNPPGAGIDAPRKSDPLAVEDLLPPAHDRRPTEAPPENERAQDPLHFKGRCTGGRVLVLAALSGLDGLTPIDLTHTTVIATPDVMPWLNTRVGLAQFVCATTPPRTLEAASATQAARTVFVHSSHLDGAVIAPRARAWVAVLDLSRAGGPVLGWSDEMRVGFFPGPGDAALALQWAAWLGPAEIMLAGVDPLEARPHWPAFCRGAKELLEARGIRFGLVCRPGQKLLSDERLARRPRKDSASR
jgi:hypothetical protein